MNSGNGTTVNNSTSTRQPTTSVSRQVSSARTPLVSSTTSTLARRSSTLTTRASKTPITNKNDPPNTPSPTLSRRLTTSSTTSTVAKRRESILSNSTSSSRITSPEHPSLTNSPSTSSSSSSSNMNNDLEMEMTNINEKIKNNEEQIDDISETLSTTQIEIDELHKLLEEVQSQQEEKLLEAILELTDELKIKEIERDEGIEKLKLSEEKAETVNVLKQQIQEMEDQLREEMESLRQELESVNKDLKSSLTMKEDELKVLYDSSESLREEIQQMHKSHQTRMTNLSNQLRQDHNEEINSLLEEQDKQLQEQSNASDMNKVDLQRKQMLELERNIHSMEQQLIDIQNQFEMDKENLLIEMEDKIKLMKELHNKNLNEITLDLKEQISKLEEDHHEQLEDIEKQHQSQITKAMSSVDNENIESIKTDIKNKLDLENEQKFNDIIKQQETLLADLKTKVNKVSDDLEHLRISKEQEKEVANQKFHQHYLDKKESDIKQIDDLFQEKLNEKIKQQESLIKEHQLSLESKHQEAIKALEEEHHRQIDTKNESHKITLNDLQSSTASAIGANTERELRSNFDTEMEKITEEHRQALENLQSEHHSAIRTLEQEVQDTKEIKMKDIPAQPDDDEQLHSENDSRIEAIRSEIQAIFKDSHANNISKVTSEHESNLNQMKRDFILKKDRTTEKMTTDFEAHIAGLKKTNADKLEAQHQQHKKQLNQLSEETKALIDNEQQPINEQHHIKKDELSSIHQVTIQSLMNEFEQQKSILKELQLKDNQYMEEMELLNEANSKEIEDLTLQIENEKKSLMEELEKSYEKKKADIENDHQSAIATQHNTTDTVLQNISKEDIGNFDGYSEEKKNKLVEGFETRLKELEAQYNTELKALQEQHDQKEKEVASLKEEQDQKLKLAQQQWKNQLNDINKSIEQLSKSTLEETIRTKLFAEAKENQDQLVNAFTISLRSLDISHQQAKDRLSKEHEAKVAPQKESIKTLEAEQVELEEQLKKLKEDHEIQSSKLTEEHTVAMSLFNNEWDTKEKQYIETLASHRNELEEIKNKIQEADHKYQSELTRKNEMDQQLKDQPASVTNPLANNNNSSTSKRPERRRISISLDQDILTKESIIKAKEKEIIELEEKWRQAMEEQKNIQNEYNKKHGDIINGLVSKHQVEIERMHKHFQHLLDVKDEEMNNVTYRLKAVTASRQKDIDKLQIKQKNQLSSLEDYSQRLKNSFDVKLKSQQEYSIKQQHLRFEYQKGEHHFEQIAKSRNEVLGKVKNIEADNKHLLDIIQQLQSKIYNIE
ncbi:unnamed protein product [Cunninghamella echinulata]